MRVATSSARRSSSQFPSAAARSVCSLLMGRTVCDSTLRQASSISTCLRSESGTSTKRTFRCRPSAGKVDGVGRSDVRHPCRLRKRLPYVLIAAQVLNGNRRGTSHTGLPCPVSSVICTVPVRFGPLTARRPAVAPPVNTSRRGLTVVYPNRVDSAVRHPVARWHLGGVSAVGVTQQASLLRDVAQCETQFRPNAVHP